MTTTRYGIDDAPVFVIDQSRCIGCEACVQACQECGTHRGQSLIHLERVDRAASTQTAPMVCMHCEDPTCAQVCPADAIEQAEGGIVQSALKPRCIGCTTLIAVVLGSPKPGLEHGINGTWFLLTVATESIAVLGALLLPRHDSDTLAFVCLAAFLLGVVLYLIVMTMVFLRWTFQELEPTEADPPAWIAAGAVAITVLAGANLLGAATTSPRIDRLAPLIEGVVTLAWATSTFWFPLMVAIGVWRHLVRRIPLRYHPSYWALVFPLGMYGAATYRMADAIQLDTIDWIPQVTLAIALAAWTATTTGLLHHTTHLLRSAEGRV